MEKEEEYYHSADDRRFSTSIKGALSDIRSGFCLYRLWVFLGLRDFKAGTRRTVLGNLWTILSFLFKVGCLGYVYASVLNQDVAHLVSFLAAGLALWDFLATIIGGGFSVFLSHASLIRERSDPISTVVFRTLVRLGAQLGYRLLGFFVVSIALGYWPTPVQLLFIPGLLVYFLAGFPMMILFGCLGARYRDLGEAVQPLTLLLFLVSPVLWEPHLAGASSWLTQVNPVTHFLAIVRDPLLGSLPSPLSLAVVAAILAAVWVAAILVFARVRNFIVFWV